MECVITAGLGVDGSARVGRYHRSVADRQLSTVASTDTYPFDEPEGRSQPGTGRER